MKREYRFLDRLAQQVDLQEEMIPGQPILEIAGDRRVLIENHSGVIQYTGEKICVKVGYGSIAVLGCGLHLQQMTKARLIISGRIDSVLLVRRDKK